MLRVLDIVFSLVGLVLSSPVLLLLVVAGFFDTGSPIFLQHRVGKDKKPFTLIKFRTMLPNTESVATHLVQSGSVTKLGGFLRKTKLDELPQLINVLKGEMSFVGPRPCLFSQSELIDERELRGVLGVRPGITGLAQINDIDMSTPSLLAEWDQRMISEASLAQYFKIIFMTVLGRGTGDRVKVE